jgi:hypothetical protein
MRKRLPVTATEYDEIISYLELKLKEKRPLNDEV